MTNVIAFVIIGLVAGVLSGLFGIGGGIVIIPALMYFAGFTQLKAQGTSLAIMLPPVGILAFLEYYKKGNVNIAAGIAICIAMLIGAKFGAQMANAIPISIVKKGFAIFTILVGIKMFFGK
ncbi:sulfite exporter TauE/SafE family protein [Clostridium sp. P21]|uniref:Probable membrane transporter protein n=1 Tax=Clostridium muellerianum TaxID=2716538 RepID=A0A7Y0EHP4_9CLOT|nr:sulfite exporter TauE/SafE family protein [Clostridium muellerianum]